MATRDGAGTLPNVLEAYCRLTPPPGGWRLLVVDNGSTDLTATLLANYTPRLPLRRLHEAEAGKNRALNRALENALAMPGNGGDLFIFTDDDAAPEPDWLLQWQACADAHPDDSVFGGAIVPDWAEAPPSWLLPLIPTGLTYGLTSPSLPDGPVFPGLVWGANMAIRRRVFEDGHRFDLCIGPNGADYAMGSETELTRRLATLGYRARFCRAPQVAHHIRPHQVRIDYILQKARRFGRGKFRQELPGRFAECRGVPRWMLLRYLLELASWTGAALRGDAGRKFRHRWELAFLRGYFHEAWRGVPRAGARVLVTSYSGELGGMELRMAQEVRYLQQAGHTSMLALRRFDGLVEWTQRLAREQIIAAEFSPPPFFESDWRWRQWRLRRAQWLAADRLRTFGADLVHVAMCWTHYGASMLWLARHCGVPAVISVHNAFPAPGHTDWHDQLLNQAFGGVRGIYAVSESAMAHFLAAYRPYILASTRLAVIPNGVDVERFRPSAAARTLARQRLQLPRQALVIGTVARLSAQKRPHLMINLLALLREQFPELHLVLAGSGPLEAELRTQAERMGLLPWITFTGFVEAVHELMPALDLHLLMSRNEGFGIATIEAMACGIPAIATDVPGSADILRNSRAGLLVPADDLQAAAATVVQLLADPARRAVMGRHGREEAELRYSHAVIGRQVRAFYEGLL
ncbi:glycosyltransferase [Duganella radicis]|uniref:Glycosyltransferase n=2 Tax=Duganella radicis TaxID=551988 RepID=A0A6L6PCP4_9BURK|nr:glycosyltransferase [Duganella radicis]